MAKYSVARLDEIDELAGSIPFRPVRHHFGITTFGATAAIAKAAGDRVVNEHAEDEPESSEELYVVLSGRATFELDGETKDAPAGTFVYAAPGVRRSAVAEEAGTSVLALGAAQPGQPYAPSGWELFAPLFPLFESGSYEEGADRAQELLAGDPPYAAVYYNTACFESRAGRTEDAIAHVRRAVELDPRLIELVRTDEDFTPLRGDARFEEICTR
jgi:mannose-6-phosphate isomerase-like protein (cupin superfamily)